MTNLSKPTDFIPWKKTEVFFSKEYYSYKIFNRHGEYIYAISLDSREKYYQLGFIVMNVSKRFPIPKFKHDSLASAKEAAEEHYLLFFSA